MKKNIVDVSVLMSVYSKELPEYLDQCLDSLCQQTIIPQEVILVEDGPITESLSQVISNYKSSLNIVSVRLERNLGLASALNEGLSYCNNDLVIRMDTDDISLPSRIEKQYLFMKNNLHIDVASSFIEEWDEGMENKVFLKTLPCSHSELILFARYRSPISHPACIFRKSAVVESGGYPNVYPEDYLLWVTMLQKGYTFGNIPEVLVKMRAGEGLISRRGLRFLKGELYIYKSMLKTGFIGYPTFFKAVISKSILRLSPSFIKVLLYRIAR